MSPATVGSLMIDLQANVARLQQDMSRATGIVDGAMRQISSSVETAKGVMIGLAGGLSAAAFAGMIRGAIDSAAALHDLAQQTGETVETLSAMKGLAKLADTEFSTVAAAMNKLSRNMASFDDDSKEATRALAAMGLEAGRLRQMRPGEAMQEIAAAFDQFEDGPAKSAAAMALFGKSGAELLPFLGELSAAGDLQAKVTAEQAAQADEFGDNLIKLRGSTEGWKKELAMGVLPALNDASQAMLAATNGTGGLREKIRELAADGTLERWARGGVTVVTYVGDAAAFVVKTFGSIGISLGALAAKFSTVWDAFQGSGGLSPSDFMARMKSAFAASAEIEADANARLKSLWDGETFGARIRREMADAQAATDEARQIKAQLDFVAPKEKKERNRGEKESDTQKFLADAAKREAALLAEAAAEAKLTESEKWALEVLVKLRDGKLEAIESERILIGERLSAVLAAERQKKAADDLKKSEEETLEFSRERAKQAAQEYVEIARQVEAKERENEVIGLTGAALHEVALRRIDEQIAIREARIAEAEGQAGRAAEVALIREQIEALKQLKRQTEIGHGKQTAADEAKKVAEEAKRTAEIVESSLTDALMRGFERGKDFATNLRETIYNMFRTLVLRPIIQPAASAGAGLVLRALGMGGSPAAAGGSVGAVGNAVSLGSSAMSLFSGGIGAGYQAFALSGAGQALGLSSAEALVGPALPGMAAEVGLTGMGQVIGTALPWVGAALAIASLVGAFRRGGPKSGGDAFYQLGSGAMSRDDLAQYLPGLGGNSPGIGYYSPDQSDAAVAKVVKGTADSIATYVKQLGGTADGFRIGLGFDVDPKGDAGGRITSGLYDAAGKTLFETTRGVDNGQAQQELAVEVNRLILGALQQSDVRPLYQRLLEGFDVASAGADELAAKLKEVTEYPAKLLSAIGTDFNGLTASYLDAVRNSSSAAEAGEVFAGGVVHAMQNAVVGTYAQQVTQIMLDGVIAPVIDAALQGQSISEALSQASVQAAIDRATAVAQAYNDLFNSQAFQDAIAQIRGQLASIASAGHISLPAPVAQAVPAATTDAARAAEDAARSAADLLDRIKTDAASVRAAIGRLGMDDYARALDELGERYRAQTAEIARLTTGQGAATAALADWAAAQRQLILVEEGMRRFTVATERMQQALADITRAQELYYSGAADVLRIRAASAAEQAALVQQQIDGAVARYQAAWSTMSHAEQIDAVDRVRQLVVQRYDLEASEIQKTRDEAKKLADEWKGVAERTRDWLNAFATSAASPLGSRQQYQAAEERLQRLVDAARSGDRAAAGKVTGAADIALDRAKAIAGSAADYALMAAQIRAKVAGVAGGADTAAALQTRMAEQGDDLNAIQRRALAELEQLGSVLHTVESAAQESLTRATDEARFWADTVAALGAGGAIATAIRGLPGEIAALIGSAGQRPPPAIAASAVLPTGQTVGQAAGVVQQYVGSQFAAGAAVDAVARQVYDAATAGGLNSAQTAAVLQQAGYTVAQADVLDWAARNHLPAFAAGTDFVPRDMVATIHRGERILPAADNARLMRRLERDGSADVYALRDELRQQREDNRAQFGAIARQLMELNRTHLRWDRDGMPTPRVEA